MPAAWARERRLLWISVVAVALSALVLLLGLPSQAVRSASSADLANPLHKTATSGYTVIGGSAAATDSSALTPWLFGTTANASRTGGLSADYRASEAIVRFTPGTSSATMLAANRAAGATSAQRLGKSVAGLYKVRLKQGVTVEMAIAAYSKQSGVAYAQPNYVFKVAETPNDPDFAELWGLNNTGQSGGVADADIDAPEAWETATGSRDVVVAVVDTGVDYTHPDLEANMWKNPGEIAGNGIDDDMNGFVDDVYGIDTANDDSDPMDDYGHGTHCSGTIGAVGDNGIGVAGVSWHVKIMALKFLSSSGYGTTEDAIDAIEYGAAMGADIFSNSWGGGAFDQALYDTIAGIDKVFCFAAGNSSEDTDYFANYPSCFDLPNIIAVGASTRTEEVAGFSNYGQTTVDLFAPGDEILSTVPGGYAVHGGTSMATPHVAGTAALLLSQNPTASWESLKLALMGSAEPEEAYAGKCLTGARLNAAYALECAGAATGSVSGTVSCAGAPVEGVDVAVDSTLFTTTDVDGKYMITGVPPGTHSVVATGDGYLTEVVAGVVVLSGQLAEADVHLRLAGQISGAVTAATGGSLLEDITVTAYRYLNEYWVPVGTANTLAGGTYTITGLVPDSYRVEFLDGSGTYVAQYFDGVDSFEDATSVEATGGATTSGIDAALREYGRIAGTVTASADGAPLAGVFVTAYVEDYDRWWAMGGTESEADGSYDLGGLPAGTYRVEFFDSTGEHAYEFYRDAATVTRGEDISVELEQTTSGIDAALGPAAGISGVVVDDSDGTPIQDAFAVVYRQTGYDWEPFVGAATGSDGTYAVGGLRSGSYRVEFSDGQGLYASEFYNDKQTLQSATRIKISEGATLSGIDARLDLCGGISGVVTDISTDEPLSGIGVTVYCNINHQWQSWGQSETEADGTYSCNGLPPGDYRVEFVDYDNVYAGEFYAGQAALDTATSVSVAAGDTTQDIDAALGAGGVISGVVTRAFDDSPVADAWVNVYQGAGSSWRWVTGGEATEDGRYSVGGLRTGAYKVEFIDPSGECAWEFYTARPTLLKANRVSVTAGSTRENVDATLDAGGTITGTVTSAVDKSPLQGVWAIVYRATSMTSWEPVIGAETDENGAYSVGGLATGKYKLEFFDPWSVYLSEFYRDRPSLARAVLVSVTAGSTKRHVDAALDPVKLGMSFTTEEVPSSIFGPSTRARLSRQ